jgi:DNA-binding transcriptional LysR family regulator
MDIRQLTYFIAVAQHRSFTKAAQSLHITQPSLSKMVRVLEEELGVTLFDRSSRQIELTDAGQIILRSAQQIVKSMDDMAAELGDVVHLKKGTLRLGLPPMIGGHFFPSIIERFHHKYPQIQLQIVEQGGKRIEPDVGSGDLDIGMVILPLIDESKFEILPLTEDDLMLVVSPDHRLASRERVRLHELENEAFIMFREEFTLHHLIADACKRVGFDPRVLFESSQWDFMTEMVAAKFGITLLPEAVCRSLDPLRYRCISLTQPVIPWKLAMIWRKDKYLSFAAREWIRLMRKEKEQPSQQ